MLSVYYFLFLSFSFWVEKKNTSLSRFLSYYEFILNPWISCSPLLIHIHLDNLDSDILQGACEFFKKLIHFNSRFLIITSFSIKIHFNIMSSDFSLSYVSRAAYAGFEISLRPE